MGIQTIDKSIIQSISFIKYRLQLQIDIVNKMNFQDSIKANLHLKGLRAEIMNLEQLIEDLNGGKYASNSN